jgi:hypothetical protein
MPDSAQQLLKRPTPTQAELDLFASCLAPLADVCSPALEAAKVIGYFRILSDLPAEAVFAASLQIASTREYPTWPMPGQIRNVAIRLLNPQLTPGEAWNLAHAAISNLAYEQSNVVVRNGRIIPADEWNQRIWDGLPRPVAKALRFFGGRKMGDTTTSYAQFRDEYERQATKHAEAHKQLPVLTKLKAIVARLDTALAQPQG